MSKEGTHRDVPRSAVSLEGRVALFVLALIGPLNLAQLGWRAAVSETVRVGQVGFEPSAQGVDVRYGDRTDDVLYPFMVRVEHGELAVAPGSTVVLPVEADNVYSVRVPDPSRAPWVLVGTEVPDPKPLPDRDPTAHGGHLLAGPLQLRPVAAGLASAPWDGSAPWVDDQSRLRAIESACGGGGLLTVQLSQGAPLVRYGRCSLGVTPAADSAVASGAWRVAVAGDVGGASVAREHGRWQRNYEIIWPLFAFLLFLYLVQIPAFGWVRAGVLALPCALATWWLPAGATFVWMLVGVSALLLVCYRFVRWGLQRLAAASVPARLALGSGVLVVLVGAAWGARVAVQSYLSEESTAHGSVGEHSDCLLMGYSSAGDQTLPDPSYGVHAQLDRSCGPCRNRTGSWIEAGEAKNWFGMTLCSPLRPPSTRYAIFWGGAYEDFLAGRGATQRIISDLISTIYFAVAPPTIDNWKFVLGQASKSRLRTADIEADEIATTLSCLKPHGIGFSYFHDFVVMDLRAGREPVRQALLDNRRKAVEAAGGSFINLYQLYANKAAIVWFNDFIHFSAVAHNVFASYMCSILSKALDGEAPNGAAS
jgi:hypothetical protein